MKVFGFNIAAVITATGVVVAFVEVTPAVVVAAAAGCVVVPKAVGVVEAPVIIVALVVVAGAGVGTIHW